MASETQGPHATPNEGAIFATTHWSAVLAAGHQETLDAQAALEKLCRSYWYPLYAYVRRQGHPVQEAQDLTQSFFARLLQKNYLARADQNKGRFRTFLLSMLKHFLADEWDKQRAQKRGGLGPRYSLDTEAAETRYGLEPADPMTPEKVFARRWALTLLEAVMGRLRDEYVARGKSALFDHLKECITGDRASLPYADLAKALNLSEGALKVAVHRLRQRYRELLRAEVAQTVACPDEVDDELRYLVSVLQ